MHTFSTFRAPLTSLTTALLLALAGFGHVNEAQAATIMQADDLLAGDLIITEILSDPCTVLDARGEWFEVYNNTAAFIDIYGLRIYDISSVSRIPAISHHRFIAPGAHFVFGRNNNPLTNGGVPVNYVYPAAFWLTNRADQIILGNASGLLDAVVWDNGATFPDDACHSLSLDPDHYDVYDNDDGRYWQAAKSTYGAGDFGTPMDENDAWAGPSPILYLDFNEDFEGLGYIADVTGNGYDATTFTGTPTRVADGDGYALYLDGSSYVSIPADPIAGTGEYTISIWFNTADPTDNIKLLSDAWWSGGCNASGWDLGTHYPEGWSDETACEVWDVWSARLGANPGCPTCWAEFWTPAAWNQAVITLDADTMRMYINGALFEEMDSTGNPLGAGNGEIVIGSWMGGFRMDGMMDEFRLYDVALTSDEVQDLYEQVLLGP